MIRGGRRTRIYILVFNSCPEHIGRLFFHELRFEVTGIIPKFDI